MISIDAKFLGVRNFCSGRKKICLSYAGLFFISCYLVRIESFWILFIGRIVSGISTSVLHSGFESWMIKTHYTVNLNTYLSTLSIET